MVKAKVKKHGQGQWARGNGQRVRGRDKEWWWCVVVVVVVLTLCLDDVSVDTTKQSCI